MRTVELLRSTVALIKLLLKLLMECGDGLVSLLPQINVARVKSLHHLFLHMRESSLYFAVSFG